MHYRVYAVTPLKFNIASGTSAWSALAAQAAFFIFFSIILFMSFSIHNSLSIFIFFSSNFFLFTFFFLYSAYFVNSLSISLSIHIHYLLIFVVFFLILFIYLFFQRVPSINNGPVAKKKKNFSSRLPVCVPEYLSCFCIAIYLKGVVFLCPQSDLSINTKK